MKFHRIAVGASALLVALGAAASGRITIVSEHKSAEAWVPAPDSPIVVAGWPSAATDRGQDVCVNIGFLIDKDGKTSNFTQMKAWSSAVSEGEPKPERVQPFVQVAAATVSMWRFVPTQAGKPRSIYTSASFAFEGSKALPADAIRGHCRIEDLAGFVARAKADKDRRGDMANARSDRMRAEREMVEPMGAGRY